MWFFGFTASHPRNIWILAGFVLVILVTLAILRRLAVENLTNAVAFDWRGGKSAKASRAAVASVAAKEDKLGDQGGRCLRTYALEELRTATAEFRIRIGVGASSIVYLAELGDGRFGAVKRVMEGRGGSRKVFIDELSVLLRVSHPNLIVLVGFCLEKGEQLLVFEYVQNRSLFERMHTPNGRASGPLSWSNRLNIAADIARALDYLHSVADPPVIHRDVKSANILLIDDDHAKLADFGLCKLGGHANGGPETPTAVKGSLGYVDSSYLSTGAVTAKSDVYSFGVLLMELVTGLRSTQGSATLAEWTEGWRRNGDAEILVGMLDPMLNGDVELEDLREVVDVANSALADCCEDRPDMAQILKRILRCTDPRPQPELPVLTC